MITNQKKIVYQEERQSSRKQHQKLLLSSPFIVCRRLSMPSITTTNHNNNNLDCPPTPPIRRTTEKMIAVSKHDDSMIPTMIEIDKIINPKTLNMNNNKLLIKHNTSPLISSPRLIDLPLRRMSLPTGKVLLSKFTPPPLLQTTLIKKSQQQHSQQSQSRMMSFSSKLSDLPRSKDNNKVTTKVSRRHSLELSNVLPTKKINKSTKTIERTTTNIPFNNRRMSLPNSSIMTNNNNMAPSSCYDHNNRYNQSSLDHQPCMPIRINRRMSLPNSIMVNNSHVWNNQDHGIFSSSNRSNNRYESSNSRTNPMSSSRAVSSLGYNNDHKKSYCRSDEYISNINTDYKDNYRMNPRNSIPNTCHRRMSMPGLSSYPTPPTSSLQSDCMIPNNKNDQGMSYNNLSSSNFRTRRMSMPTLESQKSCCNGIKSQRNVWNNHQDEGRSSSYSTIQSKNWYDCSNRKMNVMPFSRSESFSLGFNNDNNGSHSVKNQTLRKNLHNDYYLRSDDNSSYDVGSEYDDSSEAYYSSETEEDSNVYDYDVNDKDDDDKVVIHIGNDGNHDDDNNAVINIGNNKNKNCHFRQQQSYPFKHAKKIHLKRGTNASIQITIASSHHMGSKGTLKKKKCGTGLPKSTKVSMDTASTRSMHSASYTT